MAHSSPSCVSQVIEREEALSEECSSEDHLKTSAVDTTEKTKLPSHMLDSEKDDSRSQITKDLLQHPNTQEESMAEPTYSILENYAVFQKTPNLDVATFLELEEAKLKNLFQRDKNIIADLIRKLLDKEKTILGLEEFIYRSVEKNKSNDSQWNQDKAELWTQLKGAKNELLQIKLSSGHQVSEIGGDMLKLQQESESLRSEVYMLKEELVQQAVQIMQYTEVVMELEEKVLELEDVSNKLNNSELEKECQNEVQQYSKGTEKFAVSMQELEGIAKTVADAPSHEDVQEAAENKAPLLEQLNALISHNEHSKAKINSLKVYLEAMSELTIKHKAKLPKSLLNAIKTARAAEAEHSDTLGRITALKQAVETLMAERDRATKDYEDLLSKAKDNDELLSYLSFLVQVCSRIVSMDENSGLGPDGSDNKERDKEQERCNEPLDCEFNNSLESFLKNLNDIVTQSEEILSNGREMQAKIEEWCSVETTEFQEEVTESTSPAQAMLSTLMVRIKVDCPQKASDVSSVEGEPQLTAEVLKFIFCDILSFEMERLDEDLSAAASPEDGNYVDYKLSNVLWGPGFMICRVMYD